MLVQIILILIAIIILFALFLPNKIEFNFANNFWEIRFENLFFKRNFGSKDNEKNNEKDKILSDDKIIKNKEQKTKSEKKEKEIISPKLPVQKEENREKKEEIEKEKSNISKEADEFPEFDEISENENDTKEESEDEKEKSLLEWLEFAKEIWEKEEKTVKSLLKFVIKTVKLSLKLLIPAKINFNISVGTGEPAETGWLYSIFILLNSFFERNKRISLNYTPNFIKPELKFDGCIKYCFSIARILLFLLVIFVYIPYFQILKCVWRNRKKFRK
ncbi:MAG: hypothetical protein FWF51_07740 [Chitinivibrionia bacterium]|nr:hypothetical protein [Chitinivibrionia bacterium]